MEGKTSLSSQVVTQISWSPLPGLKGVKPPVEFGEWIRDCSLGLVENEGPHLAMMGEFRGFSRAVVPVWGFSRGTMGNYGSLSCGARDVRSAFPPVARGSAALLSSHGRGIGPQDALKKASRGLSLVVAGNPVYPRLVQVTLGDSQGAY